MSEVEYYDPPKNQMQQLLEELMDRGVIYEWYYNGEYHWSYTKNSPKLTAVVNHISTEEKNCKNCVGEWEWKGKKAYCKNRNSDLPFICDSYKPKKEKQSEGKHWKPFKDCSELVNACGTKLIWVKSKEYGTENLITAFDNDNESIGGSCVFLQDIWLDMSELFNGFTFLDNSPCGCEEE